MGRFKKQKEQLRKLIRERRKQLNLTQSEFAKLVKLTQPRVAQIETGDCASVTLDIYLKVMFLAGIDFEISFSPIPEKRGIKNRKQE